MPLFVLEEIVVCGEIKNSVFVTLACVGVYNVYKSGKLSACALTEQPIRSLKYGL
jgi:hypothetical protein